MARAPKPDDYLNLPAHALGDEPALGHLADTGLPTFGSIYRDRRAATPNSRMWLAAVVAALLSGPFAIIGALLGPGGVVSALILVVVIGPLVEEVMKVAGALYLAEVRPWLVPSAATLIFVAVCSGLVFAAVENGFYLWLIIDDPSPEIIRWRWTFGPIIHGAGSLLAGIGVARMWERLDSSGNRSDPAVALPWILTGAAIHGAYNLFATWLELFGGGI
jgi:RsiW-degrading membrane proteinase PrsW (M82 family)